MAEIRVAPQRRSRSILWVVLIVLVLAAVAAWYFLAGPGVATVGS
jgi:type IV secretory pathway component VirB8